jgi:hypothetical protein
MCEGGGVVALKNGMLHSFAAGVEVLPLRSMRGVLERMGVMTWSEKSASD